MIRNDERLNYLYSRYINNACTPQEMEAFFGYVGDPAYKLLLQQLMDEHAAAVGPYAPDAALIDWEAMYHQIIVKEHASERGHLRIATWHRYVAVAAVLTALLVGVYLWKEEKQQKLIPYTTNISPDRDGAILTLADGSTVLLDSFTNGMIANQGGASVLLKDGSLVYDPVKANSASIAYNTLTTPKGRQFKIQLPDGTTVWLNAASSITYPVAFVEKERLVKVSGEVYFEVVKKAAQPFKVQVNRSTEIEVLGTSFNINGYEEEAVVKTTLLDGSVKVLSRGSELSQINTQRARNLRPGDAGNNSINEVILKPGQQVQTINHLSLTNQPSTANFMLSNVNIERVMAWKNGMFDFNGASLPEVMKQLERWYDIDVVYEKEVPNITFGGKMTKGMSLSDMLIALEKSEVHFRMEGRILTVLP